MRFSAASRTCVRAPGVCRGSLSSFGSLVRAGWRGGLRVQVIKSLMIGWMVRALRRDRVAQPRGWREGGEGPLEARFVEGLMAHPPGGA